MKFNKLSKKDHKRAIMLFPLFLIAMPIAVPYTFIRNTFEEGQTIRGWAEEIFWELVEVLQCVFLGGYYSDLGSGKSDREKVRKLRKSGVSKELCKAFIETFGSWHTYVDKSDNSIYFHWCGDFNDKYVWLIREGDDRYTFGYSDSSYNLGRKSKLRSDYQLTEEQALELIKTYEGGR